MEPDFRIFLVMQNTKEHDNEKVNDNDHDRGI